MIATDPSVEQLRHAAEHPRVSYVAATAEASPIADESIALVTVAQALHWFDLERFHAEVGRVARPGAVVAAWTYGQAEVDAETNEHLDRFAFSDLADYWPPERRHVDDGYASLDFPYQLITPPSLAMSLEWTRADLTAYLRTWSSVAAFMRRNRTDPVQALDRVLRDAWPDGQRRTVRWPLAIRAGFVARPNTWAAPRLPSS